ncbi:MAG: hypothetical protein JRN62_03850 [Nitrososphaerota archaeon]|jgi:hypothetical protein|nr:hypothetical protein [Nitrososphaerota archaeon]MDG6948736.1 hypothetical protein [Nitrososphaerota archaeon]
MEAIVPIAKELETQAEGLEHNTEVPVTDVQHAYRKAGRAYRFADLPSDAKRMEEKASSLSAR